jgi:sialidase-1
MRSSDPLRFVATSDDGGESWRDMHRDPELLEPTCQGSLLDHTLDGQHMLLFSNPASTRRENMTIKLSLDDGESWSREYQVYAGPSAYSDLVMVSPEEVGILYEAGEERPYQGIVFETIPLAEID